MNLLDNCFKMVKGIEGDFAEFGVYQGATFLKIAKEAKSQGKVAYAFDSFQGMDTPSELDYVGDKCGYPKGKFNVGGSNGLIDKLSNNGFCPADCCIVEGFVSDTLDKFSEDAKFSFARIDLDHYLPTLLVLNWVWDRMPEGGVIICHDYIPTIDVSATKAIKEFLIERHVPDWNVEGIEVCFRKH